MPDFRFRTAVIRATSDGSGEQVGETPLRLDRAAADMKGTVRRPLRLRLAARTKESDEAGGVETTIEMSRREAYAFSEWLDAVVTISPAKRGSKA